MEQQDWVNKQLEVIEEETKDFSFSKVNLLKITSIEKLIKESANNSSSCPTCQSNLTELETMVHQISKLDDSEIRQPYEKKFNLMRRHFQNEHGYFDPYHFVSRWVLIGVLITTALSFLISHLWKQMIITDLILIGAFIGLAIGYLLGSIKDAKIRKKGMLI